MRYVALRGSYLHLVLFCLCDSHVDPMLVTSGKYSAAVTTTCLLGDVFTSGCPIQEVGFDSTTTTANIVIIVIIIIDHYNRHHCHRSQPHRNNCTIGPMEYGAEISSVQIPAFEYVNQRVRFRVLLLPRTCMFNIGNFAISVVRTIVRTIALQQMKCYVTNITICVVGYVCVHP